MKDDDQVSPGSDEAGQRLHDILGPSKKFSDTPEEAGGKFGAWYRGIWKPEDQRKKDLAQRAAQTYTPILGCIGALVVGVVGIILLAVADFLTAIWWIVVLALILWVVTAIRKSSLQRDQKSFVRAAEATIAQRRQEAADWIPGQEKQSSHAMVPKPEPEGISPKDAEHLAARWMAFLGETDSCVTRYTVDGGVDVESLHYVAQVKHYGGSVGVKFVRELAGVALADGRKPVFLTTGDYTKDAVAFADSISMPLLRFGVEDSWIMGANEAGVRVIDKGL